MTKSSSSSVECPVFFSLFLLAQIYWSLISVLIFSDLTRHLFLFFLLFCSLVRICVGQICVGHGDCVCKSLCAQLFAHDFKNFILMGASDGSGFVCVFEHLLWNWVCCCCCYAIPEKCYSC